MFAVVIPGRIVQPVPQIEQSERFFTTLQDVTTLNHICIFLTGAIAFPEGYGCTIHLETTTKGWQLIGGLSNLKPSAIFKLKGNFIPSQTSTFTSNSLPTSNSASLGILLEPLTLVEAQLSTLSTSNTTSTTTIPSSSTELVLANRPIANDPVLIAQKIALNCFTYLGGFAIAAPDGKSYIDMTAVEKWYRNIEAKLKNGGAGFLLQRE